MILQDNPGIASCGVKVRFNAASFELVQTPEGRPVSALGDCFSGGTLEMKAYANGAAALWYSAQETSASGELFSLRLRVKPGAKPGDQAIRLLCDPQQTLDAAEAPVSLETRDGTVTVLSSTKVTVTVSDAHSAAVRVESAPAAYAVAAFYSERGQLILSVLGAITDGSADIPVRAAAADLFPRTAHVETVVLLSRETNPLTVEVRMEVETGEVKEHPTYKRIQEYVQEKYGFKVHTAYIAEVKRMVGLDMHKAPNAVEQRKHEYHPCPPEKVEAIKDALRHFGLTSE